MNKYIGIILIAVFFVACNNTNTQTDNCKKPTTEIYQASSAVRSGIALGGIGTGSIELRKDGNFYNWSIFNNYPHGTGPIFDLPVLPNKDIEDGYLFFIVRYQVEGKQAKLKLLQINNSINEAALEGVIYYYPWLEPIEKIEYSGRFPFVNMKFTDKDMPFDIAMEAFSPFIPHDVENSSLPGVYFNFNITSTADIPVDVMILGTLRNLVSYDEIEKEFASEIIKNKDYKFFVHKVNGVNKSNSAFGQMGLGAIGGDEVSYYMGWEHKHPYYEKLLVEKKLANIDDTPSRNVINDKGKRIGRLGSLDNDQRCFSTIGVSHKLTKGDKFSSSFFMNWNFPNNYGAIPGNFKSTSPNKAWKDGYGSNLKRTKNIGHYYQNRFENIGSIVNYFASNYDSLSRASHSFVDNMYQSDIKPFVLNQINSNLNTFITSSTLTKNGNFVIREGITSSQTWGPTATIDVSLYGSPMIISLFPNLQKSMMRAHCKKQTADGEINHGLSIDTDFTFNGTWGVYDRIDLVGNYIQMVLRDYMWTNDKEYLVEMWPSVKKGINYILNRRDIDGDQMPDMDGIMCSYDNFPMYGLSSYIQSQWVVALTMASQAAEVMGELELKDKYANIAKKGIQLMEDKLWNGSYYRLYNDYNGDKGVDEGCLTDQLIGQWVAHCAGIDSLFDHKKVQTSLSTILDKSFIDNSFLRNCSWPEYPELFPIHESDLWVDQANTPWTGVELAFASFLIYEDMVTEGEKVIKGVDDRYRKSGLYWDHQEFGGHYYRPMSAWSILNAYLGLSINKDVYSFAPKVKGNNFKLFFSGPEGTAYYIQKNNAVFIESLTGNHKIKALNIKSLALAGKSIKVFVNKVEIIPKSISFINRELKIVFADEINIEKGSVLKIYND